MTLPQFHALLNDRLRALFATHPRFKLDSPNGPVGNLRGPVNPPGVLTPRIIWACVDQAFRDARLVGLSERDEAKARRTLETSLLVNGVALRDLESGRVRL